MDPDIRVRVALDSDPADPAPVWTDVSSRVHYGDGGQEVKVSIGRQNETADIKPTEMSWALKNGDGLFTPNNSSSPYAGKWEQGRRVQIAEVVGGVEFLLGTGFLEIPAMDIVDPASSEPVSVSAVDWMGRLESAPPFEDTLAEHVRAEGGTLREWWPLTDPSWPFQSGMTESVGNVVVNGFREIVQREPEDLLKPAEKDGPPGDDASYALWQPALNGPGDVTLAWAYVTAPINVPIGPTDTIAVSVWVNATLQAVVPPAVRPEATFLMVYTSGWGIGILDETSGITATVTGAADVVGSRELERDVWRLITVRANMATGAVDLWVGSDMVATGSGSFLAGTTLTGLLLSGNFAGALGHVQVRTGPAATTMTRAMHLAQHEHGYRGLQRQTVAERIATLAGYAGVPATEVVVPASCSTPVQAAKLSGVGPAQSLRGAATTGQDTIITDGAGRITAVPRARRYNQPVALAIPFGWIGYRGLRYRPDKPVTDVTVNRTGGASVRRSDRARAQRYGVTGQQYELDTAIDADPANLAAWALDAFGQSRTRAPSIRISMLRRSIAERQALLSLKVGDRIQITGLPAGSPDDVGHLIVQGIEHTIGPGSRRYIQFNTSPLLGPAAGQPPTGVMAGDLVAATAVIAY